MEELGITSGSTINSTHEAQDCGVDEIMRSHAIVLKNSFNTTLQEKY